MCISACAIFTMYRFSFELVEEEELEIVPVVILRQSRELKLKLTELSD